MPGRDSEIICAEPNALRPSRLDHVAPSCGRPRAYRESYGPTPASSSAGRPAVGADDPAADVVAVATVPAAAGDAAAGTVGAAVKPALPDVVGVPPGAMTAPAPAAALARMEASAAVGVAAVDAVAAGAPADVASLVPGTGGVVVEAVGPRVGLPGGSRSGPTQPPSALAPKTPRQARKAARLKCLPMLSRRLLTNPSVCRFSTGFCGSCRCPCTASGDFPAIRLTPDT